MSRLATTVLGQGDTTVLLLHGIGGDRTLWADGASGTTRAIADAGFRAVAVDLPGYGGSFDLGPPGMDVFVATLRHLIDRMAPQRLVLLGHSMGGMVAQEMVARVPGCVQGLVLACTSASFGRPDGAWQAQFIAERLAPLESGLGMVEMAARLVPGLVSPAAPAAAVQIARQVMARVPESTYRAALRAIVSFDRRAALSDIRVPTLLLAGEHDSTAPPEVMQRMAARIAGSEFQCLARAAHIANVEAPVAFNAAVESFLRRRFQSD